MKSAMHDDDSSDTSSLPTIRGANVATGGNVSPNSNPAGPSALERMLGIDKQSNDTTSGGMGNTSLVADEIGAPRSCALCSFTFPRSATAQQVLWKHVITIRRRWDPDGKLGLLPKELGQLEQGTSMFNLVHVCGFCHQYFDPDFEGGIAYPNQLKKQRVVKKSSIGLPVADISNTDIFFDERFLLPERNFFQDRILLESRARAKRLLDLLSVNKEKQEEDITVTKETRQHGIGSLKNEEL